MTEPRRWKDSPDAPIGMRELLSAARPTRPIDERARTRGALRVAKLGVAPAAAAAAVGIWTKLAAAGVIGLAAVGTVVAARSHEEPRPIAIAPAATSVPARAPGAEALPAPSPSPPPMIEPPPPPAPRAIAAPPLVAPAPSPEPVAPATPAVAPAPPESSLAAELALLEDARSVLARDPELALARLEMHRRRHGEGVLAAERDLMELDALRRAGRTSEAADRARAWLARDPAGLHSTRVRAILASLEGR